MTQPQPPLKVTPPTFRPTPEGSLYPPSVLLVQDDQMNSALNYWFTDGNDNDIFEDYQGNSVFLDTSVEPLGRSYLGEISEALGFQPSGEGSFLETACVGVNNLGVVSTPYSDPGPTNNLLWWSAKNNELLASILGAIQALDGQLMTRRLLPYSVNIAGAVPGPCEFEFPP